MANHRQIEIVVHNRNFVHEGPLTINKRLCYCYLFSDSFLICRVKKKKEEDVREVSRLASLTMLSVADLEDVDGTCLAALQAHNECTC